MGEGIRIGEIRLNFFLDRLILYGEVESLEFREVYIDVKRLREDFESEGSDKREKPNLPRFSIKKVMVEDLSVKTGDSSEILALRISFSMDIFGSKVSLKELTLKTVDVPPSVFINEALGRMDFDFDTMRLFFPSVSGNVDTLGMKFKDLSIKIPTVSDNSEIFIQLSMGDMGNFGVKNLRLSWNMGDGMGKMDFKADSLWYLQTSLKSTYGTLDLQSFPEVFLSASGKIFGGDFEISVFVDSVQRVLGSARFLGISPQNNLKLTGRANFEVLNGGIKIFGYISNFAMRDPEIVLENFEFDVKSPDLKVYSFKIYNEFMDVEGWYNVITENFYANFSLSKPTRLASFQNVKVFTFEGKGEILREDDEISLNVSKGKAWYVVVDTFRIDELEAESLRIRTDFYKPDLRNTSLSGKILLKSTQVDTLSIFGDLVFDRGKVLASVYLETIKFGRAYAKIVGTVSDTNSFNLTFDTLNYNLNDLYFKFQNLRVFLDSASMGVSIPKNGFMGGFLEGEVLIDRKTDSLYGKLRGEDLSIIKLLPYISRDLYVDTVDFVVNFGGTLSDPNLYGELKTRSLMYLEYPIDSSDFNFELSRDRITVENSRLWSKGTPLNVEVFKLFFENSIIYGHITAKGWNTDEILFFLAPESSRADIEIWLSGKVEKPNILGSILWYAKKAEFNGNVINDPRLRITFDGERMIISDVIRLGGGYLDISGKIKTNGDIDTLGISLREVYLNLDPDISARLSGNLDISGNLFEVIMVRGDIFSQELYFSKPLSQFATPSSPAEQKPLILYDIHFYAPRRLFVNSPIYSQFFTGTVLELDAEMSADITLQKLSPTSAINYGYLDILRGNVFVLDKVFNIESGRIELYGIDGNINLTSSSTIFGQSADTSQYDSVKVFVSVTGSLLNPKVEFWSQPYMGTTEILSMMFGGQAGLVSALIGTGLRRGLRIQELNVKNTGDVSQLIFGTYLGRNVYLRYFSNRIGQSEYNSIRTQYFLKNNISIYGERIEENGEVKFGTGINLRFRF